MGSVPPAPAASRSSRRRRRGRSRARQKACRRGRSGRTRSCQPVTSRGHLQAANSGRTAPPRRCRGARESEEWRDGLRRADRGPSRLREARHARPSELAQRSRPRRALDSGTCTRSSEVLDGALGPVAPRGQRRGSGHWHPLASRRQIKRRSVKMTEQAATNSSHRTGDLLRRELSWYADHYGVYLGLYQGQEWVIEVTRLADQPELADHPDGAAAAVRRREAVHADRARDRGARRDPPPRRRAARRLRPELPAARRRRRLELRNRRRATSRAGYDGPRRVRRSTRRHASAKRACSPPRACWGPASSAWA